MPIISTVHVPCAKHSEGEGERGREAGDYDIFNELHCFGAIFFIIILGDGVVGAGAGVAVTATAQSTFQPNMYLSLSLSPFSFTQFHL